MQTQAQTQTQAQAQAQTQAQAQAQAETQSQSQSQAASRDSQTKSEKKHTEDPTELEGIDFTPSSRDQQIPPSPSSGAKSNPLEDVLQMPSPVNDLTLSGGSLSTGNYHQPPHLSPPPYIHHFDTYSLVRDLSKGGFTDDQSITIMKAVRRILQNNLDLARKSLTSQSDFENESYLFKAACSELQSSLQTARNSEIQRQRSSRTQLQHEADILSQRLNQELAGLKDDIKAVFNDHKMNTREMQRMTDTSIQELHYKITVSLNSDGKSEVEGLRWVVTRRAALAVAISACKYQRLEQIAHAHQNFF